jgi:hypothetical protein
LENVLRIVELHGDARAPGCSGFVEQLDTYRSSKQCARPFQHAHHFPLASRFNGIQRVGASIPVTQRRKIVAPRVPDVVAQRR